MNLKGIDISEFNGNIDFTKVKKQVDFIYIRATYGRFGIDKRFKEYVKGCIENEIPFGLYYYSYAVSKDLAEEEVKFFLQNIEPYKEKITFPCMIDMEDSDAYKLNNGNPSKEVLTDICVISCEEISKNNLTPIIYASADWFNNKLDEEKLSKYMKWVAWWNADETKIDKSKYHMWQYSSKGFITGIQSKNVDLDYSFIDFISLKAYVLNISKINFIKSRTLLPDLDIQYLSCYKWGQDLINKIYFGLKEKSKIDKEDDISSEKQSKIIQKFFDLETKTMNYLSFYIHHVRLLQLLYNAITKEGNIVTIVDKTE